MNRREVQLCAVNVILDNLDGPASTDGPPRINVEKIVRALSAAGLLAFTGGSEVSACLPPFADQCVICHASGLTDEDSGLCDDHKYDEQRAARGVVGATTGGTNE